jgi:type II secretory pathway component PulJ
MISASPLLSHDLRAFSRENSHNGNWETQSRQIDDRIELFMVNANLPTGSMVLVAVDGTAMNPEKSTLPASHSEH